MSIGQVLCFAYVPASLMCLMIFLMYFIRQDILRLPKAQARRMHELAWLKRIASGDASERAAYRLAVKQRMFQPFAKNSRTEARHRAKMTPSELVREEEEKKNRVAMLDQQYREVCTFQPQPIPSAYSTQSHQP